MVCVWRLRLGGESLIHFCHCRKYKTKGRFRSEKSICSNGSASRASSDISKTQTTNGLQTWQRGLPEQSNIHPRREVFSMIHPCTARRGLSDGGWCCVRKSRIFVSRTAVEKENQLGNSSEGTSNKLFTTAAVRIATAVQPYRPSNY